MTISTELRKAGPFTGNGATTVFPFEFKVFGDGDVVVVVADLNGLETTLTPLTDYTVALNPDQNATPGGSITLAVALASGYKMIVTSAVPNLQPTDITNQGGFYPQVIEDALDRHTVQIQQVAEQVGRAVKVKISSGADPNDLIAQLTADAASASASASAASSSASAASASASAAEDAETAAEEAAASAASAASAAVTAHAEAADPHPQYQAALVSGENIKTINGQSVLGMGNITTPQPSLNKIINGDFRINQRAYVSGAATTAGQYTLDRWKVTGTGGITFATVDNKTTITIPSGQTLQQIIEGLNLQTGTYVLSWEGTAQGRIGGGAYGASGAVTAAIIGGTNTTIEFNAGTVANVQLEVGSVATPFEHRPFGVELALCQRYYEKSYAVGVAPGATTVAGTLEVWNNSGAINTCSLQAVFKVEKRATPTMLAWTPQGVANCVRDGSGSDRAAAFTNIGTTGARLTNSNAGNIANYSGHWTADAEL